MSRAIKIKVDAKANVKLPEMIDYATGAVVVDMVAMNDWFGDKDSPVAAVF